MKQINLKVKGMHCKSCETLLTEELQDAGGKDIKISFTKGTVSVNIDETKLTEHKVKAIIEKEGYKVQ